MTRHTARFSIGLLILLITAAFILQANYARLPCVADDSAAMPNIVFLFADDQCTYSVGCYGDEGGHDQMSFINVYGPLPTHRLNCLTRQDKYTYWWYGDDKMDTAKRAH